MQLESDFVLDAINTVLSWDLPDDVCSDAVTSQASLLAGLDADDVYGDKPCALPRACSVLTLDAGAYGDTVARKYQRLQVYC